MGGLRFDLLGSPVVDRTFVMFKPLALRRSLAGNLKQALQGLGLTFERCELRRVSAAHMAAHYSEHSGRPFFAKLLDYYDGKVVEACRVGGPPGAALLVRRKLGPSDPLVCIPGEHLRAEARAYAESGETCGIDNLVHASDSPAAAERELRLWGLVDGLSITGAPAALASAGGRVAALRGFGASGGGIEDQLLRALQALGARITSTETRTAPDGNMTIWFLPDAARILPVYVERNGALHVARSGGSAGKLLGRDAASAARALLRESRF